MLQQNSFLTGPSTFPVAGALYLLKKYKNSVLLETKKLDKENFKSYLFIEPYKVISTKRTAHLKEKLNQLQRYTEKGYYAAGFLSYEAGYGFEDKLKDKTVYDFPLLWFGIYKRPYIYDHLKGKFINVASDNKKVIEDIYSYSDKNKEDFSVKNIRPNLKEKDYIKNINQIKKYISSGETYQVNFTFKHKFSFSGSAYALYSDLRKKQSVSYSAFINHEDYSILSFSPELFFRKEKKDITTKPMKGTWQRGATQEEDKHNYNILHESKKNRSENVMIVDLLRNDLGRISKKGTVKTENLFEVEKYETLFQMISTVKSKLKENLSFYDIFKNIFPSGSVTGAPKIKTMQIIKELEKEPRAVYTGSIGFITPDNKAVFNVAIRTIIIDKNDNKSKMGIGSGIVYDSDAKKEYAECLLKSKFLTQDSSDFKLIETLLFEPENKYFLLGLHLQRLKNSSKYFDFCYNEKYIRKQLENLAESFDTNSSYKIRLLLSKDGEVDLEYKSFNREEKGTLLKTTFSKSKISQEDTFLYHKTTKRKFYNAEYKKAKAKGLFDIIFKNKNNQITEGAISNIIVKKGSYYYTPPVECGLLNGVYRQFLFERKDFPIKEKTLYKRDIIEAEKVFLCNSVRKLQEVEIIGFHKKTFNPIAVI
jgi:para-aminobenzoate synthetase/4-amino-4-deoxychorismate lyase